MKLKNDKSERNSTLDSGHLIPNFHKGEGEFRFNLEDDAEVATISKTKVKRPPRYKVLLHNDDYTTMEFVIYILKNVFKKTLEEADKIMLQVHHEGVAVCGVYIFEIAETKMDKVHSLAKAEGHPLVCSISPED